MFCWFLGVVESFLLFLYGFFICGVALDGVYLDLFVVINLSAA